MRKRLLAGWALAAAVAAAVASGCGGPAASPRPTAAATVAAPAASSPTAADPLADCVDGITYWLQLRLDGGTDPGDYQHMGLSSAQGGALRELERRAAALTAQGPLPYAWVAIEVRRACAEIAAARAGSPRPTGWP